MNPRISAEDLILQRSPSQLDESYSIGSTFTLQDRVEAIQQSSEELHEMVSKTFPFQNLPKKKIVFPFVFLLLGINFLQKSTIT